MNSNRWSKWHERQVEGEKARPGVKAATYKISAMPLQGTKVRDGRRFYVQAFSTLDLFGSGSISPTQFKVEEMEPVYTNKPERRVIAWKKRELKRVFKTEASAWAFVDTFRA